MSDVLHPSSHGSDNIKHVVMWQLKEQAEGSPKQENAARIKASLEGLIQVIPVIEDLEVGINLSHSGVAYDVVLTVTFADSVAIRSFQEHPAHQDVAAFIAKVSLSQHVVDYDSRVHPCDCLRALIRNEKTLVMPDAYDALSAMLIERAGFPAVQCSGYSMALAAGLSDEGRLGRDYNIQNTRQIVEAVTVPVMADGEDGYGAPEQVGETVWKFLEAGAAGINIEDQILDGDSDVRVIERPLMEAKLRNARQAADRFGPGRLVINARTDCLRAGPDRDRQLGKAAERANAYLEAGADMVFVPYVTTLNEVAFLQREIVGPLSIAAGLHYNIEHFNVTDLCNLGIARVSLPTTVICAAMEHMKQVLYRIKRTGRFDNGD